MPEQFSRITLAFQSSLYSIVPATITTIPHGLGVKPVMTRLKLINVTTQYGYVAGDELEEHFTGKGGNQNPYALYSDDVNIYLIMSDQTPSFRICRKDVGNIGVDADITNANWNVRVEVWA